MVSSKGTLQRFRPDGPLSSGLHCTLLQFSRAQHSAHTPQYTWATVWPASKDCPIPISDNIKEEVSEINYKHLASLSSTTDKFSNISCGHPPAELWRWPRNVLIYRAPILVGGGSVINGAYPVYFYLLVEMGLPLHLFPAYIW